ncbi:MAG: type II toxin-antitoxin system VapC family toxin [Candidatus Hydrogenedentes bacterium]|nr:type II toxin-antitoxin system VapC family toxin [Candidatus Hydrogenedentota bacterium]
MNGLVLDTHALVWLLLDSKLLPPSVTEIVHKTLSAGGRLFISVISAIEIVYLVEKGRLPAVALERLSGAVSDASGELNVVPLDLKLALSVREIPREDVRDMPDRIIAATAFCMKLPFVTRDRAIRASGLETIW